MQDSLDFSTQGDQKRGRALRHGKMKKEYDFSKGVRGKFYRSDADLRLPVYLEPDAAAFLRKIAEAKGTDVQQIVNDLIREDIDRIKSTG